VRIHVNNQRACTMMGEVAKGVFSGALVHTDSWHQRICLIKTRQLRLTAGPPELKYDVCVCHHVVVGFKEKLNSEEQEVNAGHHMDFYATERADIFGVGVEATLSV
jgi:hypothetical protein